MSCPDEAATKPLVLDMKRAAYRIDKVKRGERRRKPSAPFITSTLQQEASRKLGFTAKRTMALAQGLYEGQDVGNGGATGLITYMRTDSTNVSQTAQQEARDFVIAKYGADFLPPQPPEYKTKSIGAQEAHEAIRPTSVKYEPETIKSFLEPAMFKLYNLIWQRFVASQMEAAVSDTLQLEVIGSTDEHEYLLRASGSAVRFPGFLVVYEEAKDEDSRMEDEEENVKIPVGVAEGQKQQLVRLIPEQHFTLPPPRFSEASLVQILEANGIGRPSTYAPILSTIQQRGYVDRIEKRLAPSEIGIQVNDLLVHYFAEIVDIKFTAHMEDDLDKVAAGEMQWTAAMREFYGPFKEQLLRAQAEMPITKSGPEPIGRKCPEDGGELVIRYGRYGKFISCCQFSHLPLHGALARKNRREVPQGWRGNCAKERRAKAAPSMAARITRRAISPVGKGHWRGPAQNAAACWWFPTNAKPNAPTATRHSCWKISSQRQRQSDCTWQPDPV